MFEIYFESNQNQLRFFSIDLETVGACRISDIKAGGANKIRAHDEGQQVIEITFYRAQQKSCYDAEVH